MINTTEINPRDLPSLSLDEVCKLPTDSGIYFAIDQNGNIQYIGKASGHGGLRKRWNYGVHHKHEQLSSMGASLHYLILEGTEEMILGAERALIERFNPPLNTSNLTGKSPSSNRKGARISVYLEPDLKLRVEALAKAESRSVNSLIEYLLDQAVAQQQTVSQ